MRRRAVWRPSFSDYGYDRIFARVAAAARARRCRGPQSQYRGLRCRRALRYGKRFSQSILGCGTGANLRATCSLLPNHQTWRLVDSDEALLRAARDELAAWADSAETVGPHLHLKKGHATIWVEFACLDLATELDAALAGVPALVTASALFDLDVRRLHPPTRPPLRLISMPCSMRC